MSKSLVLKVMFDRYQASPSPKIKEEMLRQVNPYIDQLTCNLRYPHSREDSAQVCRLGFLKAIDTYKKGKSEFVTYAFNHIRWALLSHLRNERGEKKHKVDEVLWCDLPLEEVEGWCDKTIMEVTDILSSLSPTEQELLCEWASTNKPSTPPIQSLIDRVRSENAQRFSE